jgi:3-oxoacyl-[acyl-carrier-protein] synthase II
MKKRVVVTGIGVITPIGIGKSDYWNSLKNGVSGIKQITQFDTTGFPIKYAAEVTGFDPNKFMTTKHVYRLDRYSQFGIAAARMALAESKLELAKEDMNRVGIALGTSIGALAYAEKQIKSYLQRGLESIHPFFGSNVISSCCATEISIEFKIHGPVSTNCNACAASTSAIGTAYHMIRNGSADIMLAGGSEAPITPMILGSLVAARVLSKECAIHDRASRPFSKERDGIVLGEGAGIIVLEELEHALNRNACIIAELIGYASNCDAFHQLLQPPDAAMAAAVVSKGLEDAGISPGDVDYINAHGSGTQMNDKTETVLYKKVFGDRAYKIPIGATKSMIGHAMGACGALEIIASLLALENYFLPPTINYGTQDSECDLDYVPNCGRSYVANTVLKTSFGFGGYNSACLIRRISTE